MQQNLLSPEGPSTQAIFPIYYDVTVDQCCSTELVREGYADDLKTFCEVTGRRLDQVSSFGSNSVFMLGLTSCESLKFGCVVKQKQPSS